MSELVDFAINIAKSVTVPSGTVFLVGSLSHLEKAGTQSYATACINAKRRLMGAFKKCEVVPFVPPPSRRLQQPGIDPGHCGFSNVVGGVTTLSNLCHNVWSGPDGNESGRGGGGWGPL
jgi:hypothetical protein